MKVLRLFGVLGLCAVLSGCLTVRMTWEQLSPFYLGRWRYADQVYSGMDRDRLWEGLMKSIYIGVEQWPFERLDREKGRLETEWVQSGAVRKRLEMRIDDATGSDGNPSYLVSLRVLRQNPREPYGHLRTGYAWRPGGQDSNMEELILAKIRDQFRDYVRKKTPED